jgi:RNA polymerase sigma-70 factor (ECF subfamily)
MKSATPERQPTAPGSDLERLYAERAPELAAWVATHLRPSVRARLDLEDVAQEIWTRAALAYPRYDARRSTLRTWLERIARRTLIDLLRAARATPLSFEQATPPIEPAARRPEEAHEAQSTELIRQEILRRFLDELATLPRDDRELVLICGVDGRPTTEAARELAISGAAARKRWLRLRQRLALRTDLAALVE